MHYIKHKLRHSIGNSSCKMGPILDKTCIGLIIVITCVSIEGISIRHERNVDDGKPKFPEAIQMNVPMGDNNVVKLQLQKSDVINSSLPVLLGMDNHTYIVMDSEDHEDFMVYQDVENHASFVMYNNTKGSEPGIGMRGVFDSNGETYSMEPMDTRQSSRQARDPLYSEEPPVQMNVNGFDFTMAKVNRTKVQNLAADQLVTNVTEQLEEEIQKFLNTSPPPDPIRRFYEVELFFVVDYAIFDKWVQASRAIDYRTREAEAIDNIRFYFAHILNGMALRYRSVEDFNMDIRISPVALYIAKTPSASYWTEGYGIKEAYYYTEAYKALDAFEDWINQEQLNLPSFDQATLFTGNILFNGINSYTGDRRRINGLADIKGVCGDKRASINFDIGQYGSIQNSAHELGHNLGAYHDGYNNPCVSRDQYIMAVSPGELTEANFDNPLSFSYCSKVAFFEFMRFLDNTGDNCLQERKNFNNWDYRYYLQTYPGQRYTADEQCQLIYGRQSFYCGGGDKNELICSFMYCYVPSKSKCEGNPEQRAAEGTQCGDRKWCRSGQCEYDSRAPASSNPKCLYGDYQDVVVREKGYKCYELGLREPHLCYDEEYRSKCCKTCETLSRQNENCEWGDRQPDFCRTITSRDCYDENVRSSCCERCARFEIEGSQPGCEYGDKSTSCRDIYDNYSRYKCYSSNSTCCNTCHRLMMADGERVKGCEWGDRKSWCRNIEKRSCYRSDFETNCCDSCKKTGPAGCEWGDRNLYCRQSDCDDASVREGCCKTCNTHNSSPGSSNCEDKYSWCPGYIYDNKKYGICYDGRTTDMCCASCDRYKSNIPNCEYGDKASWCADYIRREGRGVCQSSSYTRDTCCDSCR